MQEIFAVSLFALVLLLIALELVNRMVAATRAAVDAVAGAKEHAKASVAVDVDPQ